MPTMPRISRNTPAFEEDQPNPLDMIEHIAALGDWQHTRHTQDEILLDIRGAWCTYSGSFTWMAQQHTLHLAMSFTLSAPPRRHDTLRHLLERINGQMWIGHFDHWPGDGIVMYRHGLLLGKTTRVNTDQIEALLRNAEDACERYYQAFHMVAWGGRSAAEALQMSLFETIGEA